MAEGARATARGIADQYLDRGDPLGWFEELYARASEDTSIVPWADLEPNPSLVDWLDRHVGRGRGFALKVGSGLGDDAEELARRGFSTTAFDISETAIALSRKRFPGSAVSYTVKDLFSAPAEWRGRFQLVLESYTLQVLPRDLRAEAARRIASFVAPDGVLLVIARGSGADEPEGEMPWPLTREELSCFRDHGLLELSFEDFMDREEPPVRRFRAVFSRRPRAPRMVWGAI